MVLTMNGNPTVQGPMPPPPPPHPFPIQGLQYHRGPPHQQMPAQTSPHLQNFSSHEGPRSPHQLGSHPDIPSYIGQSRPMDINQDVGRTIRPRHRFDGLADRLDRLNIDPTIPRKLSDPLDQNVIDVNRHPRTNADSTVVYEGWTFYRAEPENAHESPVWSRAKRRPMLLSQEELAKLVQKKNKKGQTAADQYKSLGNSRRAQVDRLIEDRKRLDGDSRFEWHCIYETLSMNVIIMKKLRSDASPIAGSPKATRKRIPEVVDIHSPGNPTDDSESDRDRQRRGGNKHFVPPTGAIPLGPSQGPPPLRRDVTMGPDRPMQGMPQNGPTLHQRPSGEMNPHVRILQTHEQNPHGPDRPMHEMPRGGPQIHQRAPEMNPHTQPLPPQGHGTHGPPGPQQPEPMMNPHTQRPPQGFTGPERRMQGMAQGGVLPQQQQPQQRGPANMNAHGPNAQMPGMSTGPPPGHHQGPPGMSQPHVPVPPPAANLHGPDNNGFDHNTPIQVLNGSGQLPQRHGSQRRGQRQEIPQIIREFPKEHQRQKHATPKVVNVTGKSPKDRGVEKWLDEESSIDEDDSELFEVEDDSSATEDSYSLDEKLERHIPGRGSLHLSRHNSRSRSRNEPRYRKHRRSGHRYTGSDGQRYLYSQDSVDIVPARTNRALMSAPTRRASIAGPARAPPRLMYSDRPERRDPLSAMAVANLSPSKYRSRELDYAVDDRDLDLERDRDFDLGYNEYMRERMQDSSDEIRLRRLAAAREAEYRELKEESQRLERLERLERARRPLRENPRYNSRRLLDYD